MENFFYKEIFGFSFFLLSILFLVDCSTQNKLNGNQVSKIDTTEFIDSAHHWYDIKDKDKIIEPLPGQKRFSSNESEKIAENILLYQKSNGGWPKNYDMQAILTDEQKNALVKSKDVLNTCFDNGATHSQLNYLARVIARTNEEKYRVAFKKGLKFILSAQYSNGGWPQFYPDTSGYRKYITYNDGAMIGVMKLLQKIVDKEIGYKLPDSELYEEVLASFKRGIECILNTQIKESDSLLVWCQQNDNISLKPANARTFEPAAICNGESSEIVEFLMSLQNPNEKVVKSIKSAVQWFLKSRIYGIRLETVKATRTEFTYRDSDTDKILVKDPKAKPIWARYYQLKTHLPIFCNRDGIIVYSFNEVERERRDGYAWYVYDPQKVIDNYSYWLERLNAN
jgi:PelA/Pel-15E family pectate lyase